MKWIYSTLLVISATATVEAQLAGRGLILDLDADKGVQVEEGDRVVR